MKLVHHKDLTLAKWRAYTLAERMAHVGSEVIRTLNWRGKDAKQAGLAFERSLELFDLTKVVETSKPRLMEISRLREAWTDYAAGNNVYGTTSAIWENEFISYTFLARNKKPSSRT